MRTIALAAVVAMLVTSGCATPLNSIQKAEYRSYQAKGLAVEEKNPAAGAAFGILPGGGSFYAREPGLGIVNLLMWPLSVLWDPVSGYEGAQAINYHTTRVSVDRKIRAEIKALDDQLAAGIIDNAAYLKAKRDVEARYAADI